MNDFIKGVGTIALWGAAIFGFIWIFDSDSDSSSGNSSVNPYVDDYFADYDPPDPDFEDYKEYIDADSVEACSDSGCYDLDADVSDGEVDTIYFNNGGYRELDAEFDEDGYGYGTGSRGDEWEVRVSEDDIEEAKERYMEDQEDEYYDDYGEYDYYR